MASARGARGSRVAGSRVHLRAAAPPLVSYIVQYYRHPEQLGYICARLRDARVQLIVHADSHSPADERALRHAARAHGALVLRSDNVHEIRGYNLAASRASANFLAFSQDDRIPPLPCGGAQLCNRPSWVDRALAVFTSLPKLGALGLHRGGTRMWFKRNEEARRTRMVGTCGDASDDVHGQKWDALLSESMDAPLRHVAFMNIGPVIVRKSAFEAVGGFNTSYSAPGHLGIGFDHELVGRLWLAGWHSAVVCPSAETAFRNGCGGKGSAANLKRRKAQMVANRDKYTSRFLKHASTIEAAVAAAQRTLERDMLLMDKLRTALPGCIDCEAGGDELSALRNRSLGFDDANNCPSADPRHIVFEA